MTHVIWFKDTEAECVRMTAQSMVGPFWPTLVGLLLTVAAAILILYKVQMRRQRTWKLADAFRRLGIEATEYAFGLPRWLRKYANDGCHNGRLAAEAVHRCANRGSYVAVTPQDLRSVPHALFCVGCGAEIDIDEAGGPRDPFAPVGIPRPCNVDALLESLRGGTVGAPAALDAVLLRLQHIGFGPRPCGQGYRDMEVASAVQVKRPEFAMFEQLLAVAFIFIGAYVGLRSALHHDVRMNAAIVQMSRLAAGAGSEVECRRRATIVRLAEDVTSTHDLGMWRYEAVDGRVVAVRCGITSLHREFVAEEPRLSHECPRCRRETVVVGVYAHSSCECGAGIESHKRHVGTACARCGEWLTGSESGFHDSLTPTHDRRYGDMYQLIDNLWSRRRAFHR